MFRQMRLVFLVPLALAAVRLGDAAVAGAAAGGPTQATLDAFCRASTGVRSTCAVAAGYVCFDLSGVSLGVSCAVEVVDGHAARFEATKAAILAPVRVPYNRGSFDFSEQLMSATYADFVAYRPFGPRLVRSSGPDALRVFLRDSPQAFRALIRLLLDVRGANWLGVSGSLRSLRTLDEQEALTELLLPTSEPCERIYAARVWRLQGLQVIPEDVVAEVADMGGLPELERSLLKLWASTAAGRFARFTDHQHRAFTALTLETLRQADLVATAGPSARVNGAVMSFLYNLITKASRLLGSPEVSALSRRQVAAYNAACPDLTALFAGTRWMTDPLVDASPHIDWAAPITTEAVAAAARYIMAVPGRTSQRVIMLRVMQRMASELGVNATAVFFEIPSVWRDFAISYEPSKYHFLDTLREAVALLGSVPEVPLGAVIVVLKMARSLPLEAIETAATSARVDLETKSIGRGEYATDLARSVMYAGEFGALADATPSRQKLALASVFISRTNQIYPNTNGVTLPVFNPLDDELPDLD